MLTQLSTIKSRLNIDEFDVKNDALLASAIEAVSARFDNECNRTLGRSVDLAHEFPADETELRVLCYPVEAVTKFELKRNESDGWFELSGIDYLIRRNCVISLNQTLGNWREQARVIYTGGYALPGSPVTIGQAALPDDLEQAAVEQVTYWFQNRDHPGVIRQWPKGGIYQQFLDLDLLPTVKATLEHYQRKN